MVEEAKKTDDFNLICSIDSFQKGEIYECDPPLPIAEINLLTKHFLVKGKNASHPKFLKEELINQGMLKGKVIYIEKPPEGRGKVTFFCEYYFHNNNTKQKEKATYMAICHFSPEARTGLKTDVRQESRETIEDILKKLDLITLRKFIDAIKPSAEQES